MPEGGIFAVFDEIEREEQARSAIAARRREILGAEAEVPGPVNPFRRVVQGLGSAITGGIVPSPDSAEAEFLGSVGGGLTPEAASRLTPEQLQRFEQLTPLERREFFATSAEDLARVREASPTTLLAETGLLRASVGQSRAAPVRVLNTQTGEIVFATREEIVKSIDQSGKRIFRPAPKEYEPETGVKQFANLRDASAPIVKLPESEFREGAITPRANRVLQNPDLIEIRPAAFEGAEVGIAGLPNRVQTDLALEDKRLTGARVRLERILQDFNPEFNTLLGKLKFGARNAQALMEGLPFVEELTPEQQAFVERFATQKSFIANNFNTIIREIAGLTQTPTETARAREELPNENDPGPVFIGKTRAALEGLNATLARNALARMRNDVAAPWLLSRQEVVVAMTDAVRAYQQQILDANPALPRKEAMRAAISVVEEQFNVSKGGYAMLVAALDKPSYLDFDPNDELKARGR